MNPTIALIPYNMFIEYSYDKKVFYTEEEKRKIFPTSVLLEKYWYQIKQEYLSLKFLSTIPPTVPSTDEILKRQDYKNIGEKFISESKEFWKGWNTLELISFGHINNKNLDKCPLLKEILLSDPNITTAFFSILEPGKHIPSHYGPFKGILRYHLGLIIPPKESGDCFISIDGETYDWKEGEGVLFDETYKHFVRNDTPYHRIILFLDVKRPMKTLPMKYLNDFILFLMGISPYNAA